MVALVGAVFLLLVFAFLSPISEVMGYAAHPEYIACFAVITALDAFQAIMFCRLRQQHRPVKFMLLKFAFIIPSILLNMFIFLVLDKLPWGQELFARFNGGVGLIFFSNLICTCLVTLGFIPELKGIAYGFDRQLARKMLSYSWPLLVLSLVGILNQVADKMLFPYLMPGEEGMTQLGIYGACVKIAMIMALLTQAFRYAYEPFVFSHSKDRNSKELYAKAMKYFIIMAMLAFLVVVFYMDILKHIINRDYWDGLKVVPIVMAAEIFMGIYFNLSFWYKLNDETYWGAIFSFIGCALLFAINIIFVPKYGYIACAWASFAGYFTAMLISYIVGQKRNAIDYDLKTIFRYAALFAAVYGTSMLIPDGNSIVKMLCNTVLLGVFAAFILHTIKKERRAKTAEPGNR